MKEIPLCGECGSSLTESRAEDHVYPWFCEHCDIVYDWRDLEYANVVEPPSTTSREG